MADCIANNFDLTAQEFCDALALHYRKSLLAIPPSCDGYSAPSSLDHFLSCRKGGLVILWHNELCDALGDLSNLLWGHVRCESIVSEGLCDVNMLVADLGIHDVWSPKSEVLFDIRICDTDLFESYTSINFVKS